MGQTKQKVDTKGDTAVAGGSALKRAVERQLRLKVAKLRGRCAMVLLWDVAKFHDTIDIPTLAARCMKSDFPARPLALRRSLPSHCFSFVWARIPRNGSTSIRLAGDRPKRACLSRGDRRDAAGALEGGKSGLNSRK